MSDLGTAVRSGLAFVLRCRQRGRCGGISGPEEGSNDRWRNINNEKKSNFICPISDKNRDEVLKK
jgi:hypothetical protein